jgi:hypothetical protein
MALIVLSLCAPTGASGQYLLTWSPSVRSWGMGTIGAADDGDLANVFFNPAVISSADGAFFTSGYWKMDIYDSKYPLLYNIGAGWAGRTTLRSGRIVRFGGGIRYNVFDLGQVMYCEDIFSYPSCPLVRSKETSFSLTAGAGLAFNRRVHAAAGLSIKPWNFSLGGRTQYKKTAYDLGLMIEATMLDEEGAKLSTTIGASFLNLGGDFETGEGHTSPLPRTYRYGLGMLYEGPTSGYFRDRFGVALPICSARIDYELTQDRTETRFERRRAWGVGAEVSILRILFLRTGFFKDDYSNARDGALGFGLGWTFRRGWCRFDFSSYPIGVDNRDRFLYGLSGGLTL